MSLNSRVGTRCPLEHYHVASHISDIPTVDITAQSSESELDLSVCCPRVLCAVFILAYDLRALIFIYVKKRIYFSSNYSPLEQDCSGSQNLKQLVRPCCLEVNSECIYGSTQLAFSTLLQAGYPA